MNENQTKCPKVSVVMPAYNAERYIGVTVRSVINQSYNNWELIIVDDCSTDNTWSVIEELSREDSRIHIHRNESNVGVSRTRNKGFELCTGDFVALLDSDDVWYEDKLHRQVELMISADVDIVYCSYSIIDENGNKKCNDFIVPEETNYNEFLVSSVFSCSTVLLSRKITNNYKFVSNFYHEDLVLWLQLLKDGYKARGLTDVLAEYRVFQGTRSANKVQSMINRYKVYRNCAKLSIPRSLLVLFKYAVKGLSKYKVVS